MVKPLEHKKGASKWIWGGGGGGKDDYLSHQIGTNTNLHHFFSFILKS